MNYTLHAFVSMTYSNAGPMVFDLGDDQQRQNFIQEIMSHEVDAIADALTPSGKLIVDDPWLKIEIRPEVAGFARTLPEHGGW